MDILGFFSDKGFKGNAVNRTCYSTFPVTHRYYPKLSLNLEVTTNVTPTKFEVLTV